MQKVNGYGKKLISGAVLLALSGLIVKALGLFYKIPLSYILSDEGMSYFNSAYTVYTFFYIICTAGVPKAISILVSEAEGEGDTSRANLIYNTSFFFFTSIGSVVTVLFLLLSFSLSDVIGNSKAAFAMLAIAPSVAFTCAQGVIRGFFAGKLNFAPIAISEAVSGVSRLFFGLLFALLSSRNGFDLPITAAFTVLGTTLGSFLGFVYLYVCKKREKTLYNAEQKKSNFKLDLKIAKRISTIAIPITLTSAIGSLSGIIDLGLIMNRLNSAGFSELQSGIMYGNYTTLVIPMLNLVATLIAPISTVLLPVVSKSEIKNNSNLLSERISFTVKITCMISVPATILFLFRSKEILSILFEDSSARMASPMLSFISFGVLFMSLLAIINTSLEGTGSTNIPLVSLLVGSIIKLIVSYILIGNDMFGILGAPIGTAVSYLVSLFISSVLLYKYKRVRIKFISQFIINALISVIALLISSIVRHFVYEENIFVYMFELIIFAVVYIVVQALYNLKYINEYNRIGKIYKI